jgi:putative membrane protein
MSRGTTISRTPSRPTTPHPRGAGQTAGHRVPLACLVVFLAVWTVLAIRPRHREDWLLENLPTFIAVPILVLSYRRFRFSDRAYVQGTLFLVLHTLGSHYTYSEVPLGAWLAGTLDLGRNHYDRLVHLASGLLLVRPMRELAFRGLREPGPVATLLLPMAALAAFSALYEIVEWLVAISVDPEAGIAFLGTQGDVWDAQKDMGLALAGAVVASVAEAWIDPPGGRRDRQRDAISAEPT